MTREWCGTNAVEERTEILHVLVNDEALSAAHYITLNFSLERVDLRSLGFKEGQGEKKTRPGVQRSLDCNSDVTELILV